MGASTATINYNSTGQVTSTKDANGNQRIYTYNYAYVTGKTGTKVDVQDSASNRSASWVQKFDARGLDAGVYDAYGRETTLTYDTSTSSNDPYDPIQVTDPLNRVSTFAYNSYGNLTSESHPSGSSATETTTYTWNGDTVNYPGWLLDSVQHSATGEATQPATTLSYQATGSRLSSIVAPAPSGSGATTVTTSFAYTAGLSQLATVTAPGNASSTAQITTTYGYGTTEKWGEPLTVQAGTGPMLHFTYDAHGSVATVTDDAGHQTSYTYDALGAVTQTTYPRVGTVGSGAYVTISRPFPGGPPTAEVLYDEGSTQPAIREVDYSYGPEWERTTVSGSTEPVTYSYDASYQVATLADGRNGTTFYNYDLNGHPTLIEYPLYNTTSGRDIVSLSYAADGQIATLQDGNNVTRTYGYTASGLLSSISYSPASSGISFTYDGYSRRTSLTDGSGTASYGYGSLNELTSATTTYTGLPARTVSYAYWPNGSRRSMTIPAPAGGSYSFSYSYDALGRPVSLSNGIDAGSFQWSYDDAGGTGWLKQQTLANGAYTTYAYNNRGAIGQLLNLTPGGAAVTKFYAQAADGVSGNASGNMQYGGAGNLLTLYTEGQNAGATTYGYDLSGASASQKFDRLVSESSRRFSVRSYNHGYDASFNPTTFRGTVQTFNGDNQRSASGYVFDGEGNPTTYGGAALTYDPENHLTVYGSVLTAGYTGDGLRAWKQNSGGVRTYFLYDGGQPVEEMDASGNPTAINTFGPTGLLARRSVAAGTSTFYQFDPQGSVSARLDGSGAVATSDVYEAYGQQVAGGTNDPFGYGGQGGYYTDRETGLTLCTFRYYDPGQGRFLNRDPIDYEGGINLYGYVGDDPVNELDPSGLIHSCEELDGEPTPCGGGGGAERYEGAGGVGPGGLGGGRFTPVRNKAGWINRVIRKSPEEAEKLAQRFLKNRPTTELSDSFNTHGGTSPGMRSTDGFDRQVRYPHIDKGIRGTKVPHYNIESRMCKFNIHVIIEDIEHMIHLK